MQDVSCTRIVNWSEALTFVETRCSRVFGAKTYGAKAPSRGTHERVDKRSTYAPIAPVLTDIDASDATDCGIGEKWIAIESAHCNEKPLVEMTTEHLPRRVKAIFATQPFLNERFEEFVSLLASFGLHFLNAVDGKFNLLYQAVFHLICSRGRAPSMEPYGRVCGGAHARSHPCVAR